MNMDAPKLTREMCLNKILLFYPETPDEAIAVQKGLFKLGFLWANDRRDIQEVNACVKSGIVLTDNKIYHSPDRASKDRGTVCSVRQLDSDYLTSDQEFILNLFNKMSARIDALSAEVAALRQQMEPQKLDKARLKGPQP